MWWNDRAQVSQKVKRLRYNPYVFLYLLFKRASAEIFLEFYALYKINQVVFKGD